MRVIIMILFCFLISAFSTSENDPDLLTKYLKAIVSQFTADYFFIHHYDNVTFASLCETIAYIGREQSPQLLYNYHQINPIVAVRPLGGRAFNIFNLDSLQHIIPYTRATYSFYYKDVVLYLVLKQSVFTNTTNFWFRRGVNRAGAVFILDVSKNAFYHVCFFCGEASGMLIEIPFNSLRSKLNKFTNFHGYQFKVAYLTSFPYFYCKAGTRGNNCSGLGSEIHLLETLKQKLNFTVDLIDFAGEVKGAWDRAVKEVYNKTIEWAIGGFSIAYERSRFCEMTMHFNIESYTSVFFVLKDPSFASLWKQIFLPFKALVWLCLLISLIAVAYLYNKAARKKNARYLEILLRSFAEQPLAKIMATNTPSRLLLASWWILSIVLVTTFRTKLIATLVNPMIQIPQSLQDLVIEGYKFQANERDWTFLRRNLEFSTNHYDRMVLGLVNDTVKRCESFIMAAHEKVAVIDERTMLKFDITENCSRYLTVDELTRLRFMKKEVFPTYHGWPVQQGTPFAKAFSNIILRLHGNGLLRYWYRSLEKNRTTTLLAQTKQENRIHFTVLLGSFLIIVVGFTISTLAFVGELYVFRLKNKHLNAHK